MAEPGVAGERGGREGGVTARRGDVTLGDATRGVDTEVDRWLRGEECGDK